MTPKEKQEKLKEFNEVAHRWESKIDYLTTTKMFKDLNEYFYNPEEDE